MTTLAGESRTYAIRGYRLLVIAALFGMTIIFGALAVSASLSGSVIGVVVTVGGYVVLAAVGLDQQRRTAIRLTVSPAALDVGWAFGRRRLQWQRVRRIRVLRARWADGRIERVEVEIDGDRPFLLFRNLSEFDDLLAQIRSLHPELIDE